MKKCILKNTNIKRWLQLMGFAVISALLMFVARLALAQDPATSTEEQATITSDQMELVDNGAQSVFTGHVVLTRAPYVLTAQRMTRVQATGIVEAHGHIVGT